MKKFTILVFVIVCLFFAIPTDVFALSPSNLESRPSEISILNDELVVSLEDLGRVDEILYSPYDSMRVTFNIPPEWFFASGSKFVLNYDVVVGGTDVAAVPDNFGNFVGVLSVVFNEQVIQEVFVNSGGAQNLEINIPDEALVSQRTNGRHELALIFNGSLSCEYDIRTTLMINSSSYFVFQMGSTPPELDLSKLPSPFFVRENILPQTTLVVVPASPEQGELEAAFNVIGGFGSFTGSGFIFETVTENQLTEELISNSNLIFVGTPSNFDQLSSIQFPLPVQNGQFADPSSPINDEGVIQLAPSPWNPNKSVLLVSGTTPESVNKAAKAISTGRIFITGSPRLALVADVQTDVEQIPVVESFRLKDLGYSTVSLGTGGFGFGTTGSTDTSFSFFLPKEQVFSDGASINLMYYSGRLVVGESSMTVALNDEKIAAIVLDEYTSGTLRSLKIDIPPGLLRFGENRLDFIVDLIPIYSCDTLGFPDYFIAVHENTQLNIPVPLDLGQGMLPLDFRLYPSQFIDSGDLGNVAFVLTNGDTSGWNVASKLAFSLGRLGDPMISNMSLAFSDDVSPELRQNNDLIVVGKASQSALLAEINDQLPAPFDLVSDTANEKGLQVIYSIPPDVSLGYLELLASPFNPEHQILVVSGNTDDGVIMAVDALTETSLRRELTGVFAVTNGTQIATSRIVTPFSQSSIIPSVVPNVTPTSATPFPTLPVDQGTPWAPPDWLLPVIIIVAVVILVLIVRQFIVSGSAKRKDS